MEIINRSGRPTERSVLDWLDAHDAELADQVRAQLFVFEDILTIDDRSLQRVLREIDAVDLATALKGVRTDVRDKIFRKLSERAAGNLTEEIDLLGPVRAHLVEEARPGSSPSSAAWRPPASSPSPAATTTSSPGAQAARAG